MEHFVFTLLVFHMEHLYLFIFFLTHSIPVRPANRIKLVAMIGQRGFSAAYSAMSLAALAWVIGAAGRAPYVPIWYWAPWQNAVTILVMFCVCILIALAIARPNPFSFGGARNSEFDPRNPGLIRLSRHPLLFALALWAFGHVVPNGDLAHVILFGVFGSFAVLGQTLIDRRKQRQMGRDWAILMTQTKAAPLRLNPQNWPVLTVRTVCGVLVFAALLWSHPTLIGVSPLP